MTPPTTPLPESSHLERLSSGGNLLTSGYMNHTRPPLLTTRGHPLGIPSSGEDFNLVRNRTLQGGRVSRSGLFVDAADVSGFGSYDKL